ncbi:hypothetical protein ACH5AO_36425 [Streptomyces sp. NPDC018964]|uniref:hypothetical protein n=1 Tax=Streptomyces sp. NPDC018964 TaxID=3365058 RepID=UPI00378DECC1
MSTKVVTLPESPKGEELEDYIAALFQASGHFVEKQIIESDPSDILELDIFATYYGPEEAVQQLIEVKSGKWGFTDLFKVVGWMEYLGLERGAFFMTRWDDRESAQRKMEPLGLDVVCFDDFGAAPRLFTEKGFGSFTEPRLIGLWRHSYGVERKFVKLIHQKERAGAEGAKAAKTYHRQINNGTFFARAPEESLALLYDAYREHPKLALGYAREIDGAGFDPHTPASDSPSYKTALRNGMHPELQACMYLEHRARLAILKAAVDYALAHPDGPPKFSVSEDGKSFFFQGLTYRLLPETFHDGIAWLREQPSFRRYATFWQQFLWGWGGFYLKDRAGEEFEWMAQYSGIPAGEIPTALEAFDRFFPIAGGWLTTPGSTDIHMLKMVPFIFQGIGAHQRRIQYNLVGNLSALKPSAPYTIPDLARRISCAVDFLL